MTAPISKGLVLSLTSAAGADGADGVNGSTWRSGTGAPSDVLGVNGDFYLRTDTSAWYGPKASGTWSGTGPNSLIGATGATGSQGPGFTWSGPLLSDVSCTDDITGVTTGLSWALTTGLWAIEAWLLVDAQATNGIRFAGQATDSLVASVFSLNSSYPSSSSGMAHGSSIGLNVFTGTTAGPYAANALCKIDITVSVTTAGTLTLWVRGEGTSLINIKAGSYGRAIKLA